jgi:hypothetical protein
MRQQQPFSRSERVWVEVTQDRDELRRRLINAQNEIDRLMGFLALLAAPVPFHVLADSSLKEMGHEFSNRLLLAQAALRGKSAPEPIERPGQYSEGEKELIRAQLREGNRLAREEVLKRGVTVHPRIAEIKAREHSAEPDPAVSE